MESLIMALSDTKIGTAESSPETSQKKGPFSLLADKLRIETLATPKEKIVYKEEVDEETRSLIFEDDVVDVEALESWRGFYPSLCRVEDGVSFVQVFRPGVTRKDVKPDPKRQRKLKVEFEALLDMEVSSSKLEALATKHGCLCGKWIIFASFEELDGYWQKFVRALLSGELPQVTYVKVTSIDESSNNVHQPSSRDPSKTKGFTKINVGTRDFTDKEDVMRVKAAIRKLGLKTTMKYKADVYTELGIYARNKYKINAAVYSSPELARRRV